MLRRFVPDHVDLLAFEGELHVDTIAEERRVRINRPEVLEAPGAETCLLEQLATGRFRRRLSGIDQTARDLEGDGPGTLPELADEHEVFIARKGDDVHPVGRFDPIEGMGIAGPRRLHRRAVDVEDLAVLEVFFLEHPPSRRGRLGSGRVVEFGHRAKLPRPGPGPGSPAPRC